MSASENFHEPNRPRRISRWLVVVVGLLLVLIVARFIQAGGTRDRFERIRKAGFPATPAELDAWYPVVLPGENAALKFIEATDHRVLPRRTAELPVVGAAELPEPGKAFTDIMRAAILEHLQQNAQTLALAHEAALLPKSRYPVDLSQAHLALLPHLAPLKALAQLLKLEALFAADVGDSERATRALDASFAAAHSLASEPLLISDLVRIAYLAITLDTASRVLSAINLSPEQLERLAKRVAEAENDSRTALARAMAGERALGASAFKMTPAQQQAVLGTPGNSGSSAAGSAVLTALKITGLQERDFRLYLQMMGDLTEAAQLGFPQGLQSARRVEQALTRRLGGWWGRLFFVSRMTLPAMTKSFEKEARIVAQLRAASVALAIEHYRATHNKLPVQLDELSPAFLARVPADPFDGQPLQLQPGQRGYQVVCPGASADPSAPRAPKGNRKLVAFAVER